MKVGKLQRNGTSLCVNVSSDTIRQLGWMPGDVIHQKRVGDLIVLRNINRPNIRFVRTQREYVNSNLSE